MLKHKVIKEHGRVLDGTVPIAKASDDKQEKRESLAYYTYAPYPPQMIAFGDIKNAMEVYQNKYGELPCAVGINPKLSEIKARAERGVLGLLTLLPL